MKSRVPYQEVDQRGPGERWWKGLQARKLKKEDGMDRSRWRKLIKDV